MKGGAYMTLKEKFEMMESLDKDVVIFCDMDGVLAQWEPGCTYERTWEPNYFLNRDLEPSVKEALLLLVEAGFNVCILSAAYMNGIAEVDKTNWLDNNGMEILDRLFVPCGRNKADFVMSNEGVTYILLDDYNPNLISWRNEKRENSKFIAVKFLNGLNGGTGTWDGPTIYHRSSGEVIANTLADLAVMS